MDDGLVRKILFDSAGAVEFLDPEAWRSALARWQAEPLPAQALSWLIDFDETELAHIEELAEKIRQQADAVVLLGVGGSQAGAKAIIEALREPQKGPEIIYAGHNFSGHYLQNVLLSLAGKEIAVIAVSKSGNTAETLLAFGVFRQYMKERYGEGAKDRIYVISGYKTGALGKLAQKAGYAQLSIPPQVGGRYSIFTSVALLPIAAAGIDIRSFLAGGVAGMASYGGEQWSKNPCLQYALWRYSLYRQGYQNELWVTWEPCLSFFGTWWRQLFVESESKDGEGDYPVVAEYSNDLHYLGQYLKEGPRNIFETVVWLAEAPLILPLESNTAAIIGMEPEANWAFVNEQVMQKTREVHRQAGVPQLLITLPHLNAYHLGELAAFFAQACLVGASLLGCDPLSQPAVDTYKDQVRELLKKDK